MPILAPPSPRRQRGPTRVRTVRSKRLFRNYLDRLLWLFEGVIRRG